MTDNNRQPGWIGDLRYDAARGTLSRDDTVTTLSVAAARVLSVLASQPGQTVSRTDLCRATGLDRTQLEEAAQELSVHLESQLHIDAQADTCLLNTTNSSVHGLIAELRQRKVFRIATGYVVTGWLLLQVAELIFPIIGLGDDVLRSLLIAIILGFPVAVAAAWAFELTPQGLVADWRGTRRYRTSKFNWKIVDRYIIAGLLLIIAILIHRIWSDRPPPPELLRVVAVKPFATMSNNEADKNLCEGFAEEIRIVLNRLPNVNVASRTMTSAIINAESKIAIGWLIEGTCQLVADAINVTVTLTDVTSGLQKWGFSDSRSLDKLLAFEDDIAAALALELSVKSAPANPGTERPVTLDPQAYRLYLQGRGYLSRPHQDKSLNTAVELFANAVSRDQDFASAHAGLCEAHLGIYLRSHEGTEEREAESACLRASRLGPSLPEVHIALGRLFHETGDYTASEDSLRRALELKPRSEQAMRELANLLAAQNRNAQARTLYREAIAIPPGSWQAHSDYGRFLLRRGNHKEAALQFEQVVQLTPDNASAFNNLGATYLQMGELDKAALHFERAVAISPVPSSISNYGTMLYYLGRFAEAENQFREAARIVPADNRLRGNVADAVYQMPDRRDEAISEYHHAIKLAEQRLTLSRKDTQTLASLAWYLARTGEHQKAAAIIDEALSLSPDDPEVLFAACLVSIASGKTEAARVRLSAAIDAGFSVFLLKASPDLKPLALMPDFNDLLNRHDKETHDAES